MTAVDDVRTMDPVSYIRALGLQSEDSLGFCPNFAHGSIYFGWRKS